MQRLPHILLSFLVVSLTSCGGIRHYLHSEQALRQGGELPAVELAIGEERKVLKHSQGIAIVGGYKAGLWVEDSSIASVRYGSGSEEDHFAPEVFLIGRKAGETKASYANRLGDASTGAPSFKVIVRDASQKD